MKLYKEASLMMLPTSVKDGKLYSIFPQPKVISEELVTNGGFSDGTNNWTNASSDTFEVADGGIGHSTSLHIVVSAINRGAYQSVFVANTSYFVSLDLKVISGSVYIGKNTKKLNNKNYDNSEWQTISGYLSAIDDKIRIYGNESAEFYVDNISIVEVDQAPADFDFSRGSNLAATRINEQGLIEKGRENLLLYSNQFDTNWTGNTNLLNNQIGYDGLSNAWLSTFVSFPDIIRQTNTNSGVQTLSIYAKGNINNGIRLYAFGTLNCQAFFNLNNGTLGNTNNVINATIEDKGNGWYRCAMTFNQTNSSIYAYLSNNSNQNATSGSIYIQDAQLEVGLVATDYIESGATTGKAGVLEDLPRLNWGGSCPSLLLEPSRQNLIAKSEYTEGQNVTITYNDITSPEGVVNAAKFVENTALNTHNIFKSSILPTNASAVDYTVSVFAKKKEREYVQMQFYADSTVYNSATFDLSNGTTSGASSTHKIEDYGNGWYRCSFTASVINSTGGYNFSRVNIGQSTSSFYYTGDGASGLYYYGFQVEEGSYATSYIPTHGTSVTRSGEVYENTDLGDYIGTGDATFFFDFNNDNPREGTSSFFRIYSGTDLFSIKGLSGTGPKIQVRGNTGFNGYVTIDASENNTRHKVIARVRGDLIDVFYNGSKLTLTITGLSTYAWSELEVSSTGYLTKANEVTVFDTALSDNECINLTSI